MAHTHRYRRVNIARKGNPEYWVMQCSLSNCSHYIQMKTKLSAPLVMGKPSLCNNCNNEFAMDKRSIRMAKPICIDCVEEKSGKVNKNKKVIDAAAKFFDDLTKGIVGGQ